MTREQILLTTLVALVIWGILIYNLIKGAVSSANKPLEEKLDRLIELKEKEVLP